MDGYAVRAADVADPPASLRLIGESAAGRGFDGAIGPRETVRIFTGAAVPAGADAIVIQENAERSGERVVMRASASAGRFIRPAGFDFRAGEVLLRAGRRLGPRDLGLAAAMNRPWLKVRRRPRIALLATGDELAQPGEPLAPSQIINSNAFTLAAFVTACGGEPIDLGIAADDQAALLAAVAAARGADLLVIAGGASVGDHDLVRPALAAAGFDLGFYKVAMRPGKPLMFGRLDALPVLGLPGNPVSVGVTALLFLKPAIETLLGLAADQRAAPRTAILGRDLPANDERQDYLRARLSDRDGEQPVATPFERQDSALSRLFAEADCLVIRAPHAPPAKAGTAVPYLSLDTPI
jgi:molybdopterin molybdotransferase